MLIAEYDYETDIRIKQEEAISSKNINISD